MYLSNSNAKDTISFLQCVSSVGLFLEVLASIYAYTGT